MSANEKMAEILFPKTQSAALLRLDGAWPRMIRWSTACSRVEGQGADQFFAALIGNLDTPMRSAHPIRDFGETGQGIQSAQKQGLIDFWFLSPTRNRF